MRKKELIKRVELLEFQLKNAPGSVEIEAKIRAAVQNATEFLRETVYQQGQVLKIYKDVLLRSGVIINCEADRTEYQWLDSSVDSLHRNFHFKVNEVLTKKEKQ